MSENSYEKTPAEIIAHASTLHIPMFSHSNEYLIERGYERLEDNNEVIKSLIEKHLKTPASPKSLEKWELWIKDLGGGRFQIFAGIRSSEIVLGFKTTIDQNDISPLIPEP